MYLHGFVSGPSSQKLNFFKERFAAAGRELVTPDLNGDDFEHMTLTSQLAIIRSECARAPDAEWVLLGSSLGAYLATLFAQRNAAVGRLVLFAPAFQFISRNRERLGTAALEAWRATGRMDFEHYHYKETRALAYDIVPDAEQYDRIALDRDLPALIFHGLGDELVPYELSVEYLRSHSQAQLVLLADDHQLLKPLESIWRQTRTFLDL